MRWMDAAAGVACVELAAVPAEVVGVEYDSRRVGKGDVFVAMRGGVADGNRFIEAAVAQGAAAVVTDSREAFDALRRVHPEGGAALGERGGRALAQLSAAVLGHPERKLALSAVTGTNGKTTTALLLESMLRSVARKCVLIGTIETHVGDEVRVSPHTTPEASDTLRVFAGGGGGGSDGGGDGDVEPRAGAGAGVGSAGGCGDLYESDAGPSGLSQHDGEVLSGEGAVVRGGGCGGSASRGRECG